MAGATSTRSGGRLADNAVLLSAAWCGDQALIGFPNARLEHLDWGYILAAAERQGLTPLLHRWLIDRPGLAMPDWARERAQAGYWASHFHNRALLAELARVLRAAAAGGVAVMPLKGAVLAFRYYAAPALRPMSDLDLLVRPVDRDRFAEILLGLGYRETAGPPYLLDERHRDPFHQERAFVLDSGSSPILVEFRSEPLDPVFWHLTELDSSLSMALRRHADHMWRRGQPAMLEDAPFVHISAEDLLLHVASHLTTRHGDYRLLWLHDLGRIRAAHADAVDWAYLGRAARSLRLASPVLAALQAAALWVGVPIPLDQVRRDPWAARGSAATYERIEHWLLTRRLDQLVERDLTTLPPSEIQRQVASLLRLRGPSTLVGALRWAVLPSRAYMEGWRGPALASSRAGYGAAVALRLVVILLQALVALSGRLALPLLPSIIERVIHRIYRGARFEPFAAYRAE